MCFAHAVLSDGAAVPVVRGWHPLLSVPSGFLVVFEKPNRSSFTFTFIFTFTFTFTCTFTLHRPHVCAAC